MVKDNSDSERGNPLLPQQRVLFPIGVGGEGGGTINMPISTEGSDMPTMRPSLWAGGRRMTGAI